MLCRSGGYRHYSSESFHQSWMRMSLQDPFGGNGFVFISKKLEGRKLGLCACDKKMLGCWMRDGSWRACLISYEQKRKDVRGKLLGTSVVRSRSVTSSAKLCKQRWCDFFAFAGRRYDGVLGCDMRRLSR